MHHEQDRHNPRSNMPLLCSQMMFDYLVITHVHLSLPLHVILNIDVGPFDF